MDDELRITIPGVSSLPAETQRALRDDLARRGKDLLDEAGRLEAEINSGLETPMITPAIIAHASFQRSSYGIRRKLPSTKHFFLGGTLATFVGGVFANNVTEGWGAIGLVVCGLAALVCFNKGWVE